MYSTRLAANYTQQECWSHWQLACQGNGIAVGASEHCLRPLSLPSPKNVPDSVFPAQEIPISMLFHFQDLNKKSKLMSLILEQGCSSTQSRLIDMTAAVADMSQINAKATWRAPLTLLSVQLPPSVLWQSYVEGEQGGSVLWTHNVAQANPPFCVHP